MSICINEKEVVRLDYHVCIRNEEQMTEFKAFLKSNLNKQGLVNLMEIQKYFNKKPTANSSRIIWFGSMLADIIQNPEQTVCTPCNVYFKSATYVEE